MTAVVWSIGTHAEAHALHLALVAILLRLLVAWEQRVRDEAAADRGDRGDRYLVAAAATFGLAVGNHSLTLLLAPAVALYVLAVDPWIFRRPRLVATCVACLAAVVVLVFLELPLRAGPFRAPLVYGRPETWDGFWYIVLAEQFRGSLYQPFSDLPGKALDLVARTVDAYGPLAVLVPIGFLAHRDRPAPLRAAVRFGRRDHVLLRRVLCQRPDRALLPRTGAHRLDLDRDPGRDGRLDAQRHDRSRWRGGDDGRRAACRGWWSAARPAARPGPGHRLAVTLLVPTALAVPDRLRAVDRSDDLAARRWVDRALELMEPDAVIVSWWSFSTPLWYAQHVEGRRPDLVIVDDRTRLDQELGDINDVIDANLASRPVYVIRIDRSEVAGLAERYDLEHLDGADAATLTRVIGRRGVGSGS